MEEITMSTLITELGTMFTTMMSNVGTVADTIVAEPLFLLPVAIFFAGACIGFGKRMLHVAQ